MTDQHNSDNVRVRIAPSPTGVPHVGTAYVALFNLAFARQQGGEFLLRIEDTDRERSERRYEEKIMDGLRWLHLDWDEGPEKGGPAGPYRQSERSDTYRTHAEELVEKGKAYECFCSEERLENLRKKQEEEGKDIGYDGKCRDLSEEDVREKKANGESFVIRLRSRDDGETTFRDLVRGEISVANSEVDDQVLLKSDGFPTYHLANVVDDHLMGISHVMRAEEWVSSTPKHIQIYEAFGWEPPEFVHLPLLRNEDRSKISKRENPVSILWYRDQGYLPEALLNFLSLMGFSMPDERELYSFDELVEAFSFDRLRTTGPVFDVEKLDWVNGNYIRDLEVDELADRLMEGGFAPDEPETVRAVVPLIQERLDTLADFDEWADYFFRDQLDWETDLFLDRCDSINEAAEILEQTIEIVSRYDQFEESDLEDQLRDLAEELDVGVGAVFMTLRIALTAKTETPPVLESMDVLGTENVVNRLNNCLNTLKEESNNE